jgi:hypothetical protein
MRFAQAFGFIAAISFMLAPACAIKPMPDALSRGQAEGSLNGKDLSTLPQCAQGAVSKTIYEMFDKIAGFFGGELKRGAHCGNYKREIAAGVTVENAPTNLQYPKWDYLGGHGDVMADAAICLMKDIGAKPGGYVEYVTPATVGPISAASIQQRVGLKDFSGEEKRAELYNQIRICAPIMGCLDAQRQDIVAIVRSSVPAWPGGMRGAGDYPIKDSYSLEVSTQWADSNFSAKLPEITVATPYGDATFQPGFTYSSSLYPIDTPFSKHHAASLYLDHPNALQPYTARMQDLNGRSGTPFIINMVSHLPVIYSEKPDDWPEGMIFRPEVVGPARPEGWSSQLAFGSRNGSDSAKVWAPAANVAWPVRPDIDLDAPRSMLERAPTAKFVAESPIILSPPGNKLMEMLPAGVPINDMSLTVTVNPIFTADYAAQVGIEEREGAIKDCLLSGELTAPCGLAEALLYTQTRAEASAKIDTTVHLWIDFDIPVLVGMVDPDINKTWGPKSVPLFEPDVNYKPAKPSGNANPYGSIARASVISDKPKAEIASYIRGLSGLTSSDINGWRNTCLTTPPKSTSKAPDPAYTPGNPDDLMTTLLPCNICIADNVADYRQARYQPFYFPDPQITNRTYPASQNWSCLWLENIGCFDLCSWTKVADDKTEFTAAVHSAVEVVGDRCKTPPPPEPPH